MKISEKINAKLPKEVADLFEVKGLQCGHKAEIAWAVFGEKQKNGTYKNHVGVAIHEAQPAGSRIKQYRQKIDFSTITVSQMEKLMEQHCPFISPKPQQKKK